MQKSELLVATAPRLHKEVSVLNPYTEDPSQRILDTLQNMPGYGRVAVEEGEFQLLTGPALTSHHPVPKEENDLVLWVGRQEKKNGLTLPWGEEHLQTLVGQQGFWGKVESWINEQRQTRPTLRFYLLMGHPLTHPRTILPEDELDVYKDGMQTQAPLHMHRTTLIDRSEIPQSSIMKFDSHNHHHRQLLATFMTSGGESVGSFNEILSAYNGRMKSFEQTFLFEEEEYTVNRPFLGFSGFGEAFSEAVKLQQLVKDTWLAHAVAFGKQNLSLALGALQLHHRQSSIPNMTLISLSDHDRQILGVDRSVRAAVLPFNLSSPQSLLDGVLLDRPKK